MRITNKRTNENSAVCHPAKGNENFIIRIVKKAVVVEPEITSVLIEFFSLFVDS